MARIQYKIMKNVHTVCEECNHQININLRNQQVGSFMKCPYCRIKLTFVKAK